MYILKCTVTILSHDVIQVLLISQGFSNEDDAVEREARITYQSYADLWLALLDEKRYRVSCTAYI